MIAILLFSKQNEREKFVLFSRKQTKDLCALAKVTKRIFRILSLHNVEHFMCYYYCFMDFV